METCLRGTSSNPEVESRFEKMIMGRTDSAKETIEKRRLKKVMTEEEKTKKVSPLSITRMREKGLL